MAQHRKEPAKGIPAPRAPGMRSFQILLPDDMADKLYAEAVANGVSFSEIVRVRLALDIEREKTGD